MEQFKRNVIMNKAGGASGKNTYSYKLSLPARVIKELGVTPEDKGLIPVSYTHLTLPTTSRV